MSRPRFGNRVLSDGADVFSENAWDNIAWNDDQLAEARRLVAESHAHPMTSSEVERLVTAPSQYWDRFYGQHQNRFFHDRHWLFTEFEELAESGQAQESPEHPQDEESTLDGESESRCSSAELVSATENLSVSEEGVGRPTMEEQTANNSACVGSDRVVPRKQSGLALDRRRVWEIGCGAGNTVFPLLKSNRCRSLFVYASDFSQQAVSIVNQSPNFEPDRCHAFVNDITDPAEPLPFPPGSIHCIVLIFVLSAVEVSKHEAVAQRLERHLAPGGVILFRDYGRYDMAELRFKKGRCLGEHSYARGDGTLVHFFTRESVRRLFVGAGLCEVQNIADRRLQVKRGRQLKMYRVWIQAKYQKPNQS